MPAGRAREEAVEKRTNEGEKMVSFQSTVGDEEESEREKGDSPPEFSPSAPTVPVDEGEAISPAATVAVAAALPVVVSVEEAARTS